MRVALTNYFLAFFPGGWVIIWLRDTQGHTVAILMHASLCTPHTHTSSPGMAQEITMASFQTNMARIYSPVEEASPSTACQPLAKSPKSLSFIVHLQNRIIPQHQHHSIDPPWNIPAPRPSIPWSWLLRTGRTSLSSFLFSCLDFWSFLLIWTGGFNWDKDSFIGLEVQVSFWARIVSLWWT